MKTVALFLVFVTAKIASLVGLSIPISVASLFSFIWQDAAIAIVFSAAEIAMRRHPRASWILYASLCTWAIVHVAVFRALSTPFTLTMLRAAGGALSDSFQSYATMNNAIRVGLVALAAMGLPLLLFRFPRFVRGASAALPVIAVMGYFATPLVDTRGWHRNPVIAFVASALPRLTPQAGTTANWRTSPFGEIGSSEEVAGLRGIAARRNVVHVILESTAERYLKTYGAAEDTMPRLDALAREGVVFENAYTTYPESIKGLFAVLCSSYPAFDTVAESYAKVPCDSIARALGASGYRTGLFHSGRFAYLGMEEIVRQRGFDTLEDAGQLGAGARSSFGLDDERDAVRRILQWIDEGPKDRPFYAAYLPIAGHHPYNSPQTGPYPQDGEIGSYRNSLLHADTALGVLLDGLKERGLVDKTLFVIHGDHGEAFGQHEGNFAHSLQLFEENIRVPLVFAAPGAMTSKRVGGAASLVDVAPTILSALGAPLPTSYQGQSLWDGVPPLALFYADYSTGLLGLRDGAWKFILEVESRRSKLYRLTDDPGETRDLAAEFPERVNSYSELVLRWSAAQKHRVLQAAGTFPKAKETIPLMPSDLPPTSDKPRPEESAP